MVGLVTKKLQWPSYSHFAFGCIFDALTQCCNITVCIGFMCRSDQRINQCVHGDRLPGWRSIIKLPGRQRLHLVHSSSNSTLTVALYRVWQKKVAP